MKTFFKLLLVAAMMIPFSCSKESATDPIPDNLTATQAKGKKHAVPISARLSNVADPNQPIGDFQACFDQDGNDLSGAGFALSRNILSGTMTHLGKLQPGVSNEAGVPISGSFGNPISCLVNVSFDEATTVYEVNYVGANGDEIHTVENVTLIFNLAEYPDYSVGTFEGTIEIVGGTGRFANATGHMVELDATFGPGGSSWRLEGEITY
ncbi:MAG: hypothetical protein MUO53_16075 [Maribacter sp.]|nr:hypothetical protein [Maribacter sp.]